VFTAAREGHVDYSTALELAGYLGQETSLTPWKAFARNARYVDQMMVDSQYYIHWQVQQHRSRSFTLKFHWFDLLLICTTDTQRIEPMEFEPYTPYTL